MFVAYENKLIVQHSYTDTLREKTFKKAYKRGFKNISTWFGTYIHFSNGSLYSRLVHFLVLGENVHPTQH